MTSKSKLNENGFGVYNLLRRNSDENELRRSRRSPKKSDPLRTEPKEPQEITGLSKEEAQEKISKFIEEKSYVWSKEIVPGKKVRIVGFEDGDVIIRTETKSGYSGKKNGGEFKDGVYTMTSPNGVAWFVSTEDKLDEWIEPFSVGFASSVVTAIAMNFIYGQMRNGDKKDVIDRVGDWMSRRKILPALKKDKNIQMIMSDKSNFNPDGTFKDDFIKMDFEQSVKHVIGDRLANHLFANDTIYPDSEKNVDQLKDKLNEGKPNYHTSETLVPGETYEMEIADLPPKYKVNYKRGGKARKDGALNRTVYRKVKVKYLGPATDKFVISTVPEEWRHQLVKVELPRKKGDNAIFTAKDYMLTDVAEQLNEGLEQGELEDSIENIIDIDTYKSKILSDDESIVVVFQSKSKEAAYDLSAFIEKSPYDFMDTEVSDAPDKFGKHSVFCEIERNKMFIKHLLMIMKHIRKLTNQDEWFFTAYKLPGKRPLTGKELKAAIRLEKVDALPDVEEVMESKGSFAQYNLSDDELKAFWKENRFNRSIGDEWFDADIEMVKRGLKSDYENSTKHQIERGDLSVEESKKEFKHRPGDYTSERFKHDRIKSYLEDWDADDLRTWIEKNIEPLNLGTDDIDFKIRNNQDEDLGLAIISKYEKLTDGWWSDVFEKSPLSESDAYILKWIEDEY